MEIKNAALACVGAVFRQYPTDGRKEIVFAGKSNVGKSTLINTLCGRKSLARTSSQPGKTRTINFYDADGRFYIVDVPGYGYAKASKSDIEKWGKMTEEYLQKRKELAGIVLLIDIRHEPGKNDKIMYDWLKSYGYKIIIAATKSDKINKSQIQKNIAVIKKTLGMGDGEIIIPFSGVSKAGKQELLDVLEKEFEL